MIFESYPTIKGQEVQFDKHFSIPCYTARTKMLNKMYFLHLKLQSTAGEESSTTLSYDKYYDELGKSYNRKTRLSYILLFLKILVKYTT